MRLPTWSLAVLSLPSTKSMADERETEPPGWVAWRARTTGHRRVTTRRRRAPQLGKHARRRGAPRRRHLIFLFRSPRVGRGERERPGEPRACTPVDQSKSEKEKERDSDELRKGKEIKREKKPLTLTIPNRSNRRTGKENQNRRGKKGKGVAYLAAVQRCCHVGAREKKGRTGAAARWARKKGRRGQAARRRRAHPLGSTRAGEGAGDGAKARSTA